MPNCGNGELEIQALTSSSAEAVTTKKTHIRQKPKNQTRQNLIRDGTQKAKLVRIGKIHSIHVNEFLLRLDNFTRMLS